MNTSSNQGFDVTSLKAGILRVRENVAPRHPEVLIYSHDELMLLRFLGEKPHLIHGLEDASAHSDEPDQGLPQVHCFPQTPVVVRIRISASPLVSGIAICSDVIVVRPILRPQ